MRRKVELIQQIRAMESVPAIRIKFVDITETGGQGLLSEMSVAEVHVLSGHVKSECVCSLKKACIYKTDIQIFVCFTTTKQVTDTSIDVTQDSGTALYCSSTDIKIFCD